MYLTNYMPLSSLILASFFSLISAEILTAPETQRVAINSGMAKFYCRAMGHNARWLVDGSSYDPQNATIDGLKFTEFITYDPDEIIDNNIYDIYIQVPSSLDRNSTEIRCLSVRDQPAVSELVKLIIMGGPAAPEPSLHAISTSLLTLEWNKPFSWPEFPIEHYTLTSNHSLYYPSEIRINNATLSQGSMQIEKNDGVEECEVIEFTLKANNGLADSPAGTVTGGFPIVVLSESSINYMDTGSFVCGSSSKFNISFIIQLPLICWFQVVHEYNVTVYNGAEIVMTTSQRLLYWEQQVVLMSFEPVSELITNYTVNVNVAMLFETFAGNNIISTPVQISETITCTTVTGTGTESPTRNSDTSDGLLVIIGVLVAVMAILVTVVAVVVILAIVAYTLKAKRVAYAMSGEENCTTQQPDNSHVTVVFKQNEAYAVTERPTLAEADSDYEQVY